MLLIFDLDGTLVDSSKDLAIAMNATREHAGLAPIDSELVYRYVGNGAAELVRRALGPDASEQLQRESLVFFLDFYANNALGNTFLYPGIKDAVATLNAAGHTLAVLTNKPSRISIDVVHEMGLSPYFARIYGGDSLLEKKPDPEGIDELRGEFGTSIADTLMIGDSAVDIRTARNAGVKSCGVLWGFQPESFDEYSPDYRVSEAGELVSLVSSIPASR